MTIREYCACKSCSKKYMVRYGMGDQFPQMVSFFCKDCGEKLTFGFDKDRKSKVENLEIISEDNTAETINLHPELIMDESAKSDPYHFASLEFMTNQYRNGDKDFQIMRKMQLSIIRYNKSWDLLSKDFRLLKEKRFGLIDKKYGNREADQRKRIVKTALASTRFFIEGPWKKLYDDSISELELARRVPLFSSFRTFLKDNEENFVEDLYNLMNDFSKVRTEMLVTLATQKCGHDITGISSTVEWEKLEKVYGDLYEKYGDLMMILTGINNLNSRGNYEVFNSAGFTFQDYLNSDKANRFKNFETNTKLVDFKSFYDAGIRNGTHHKNSKIDKEKQEIILGVGKGGRTEKKLSFVEYISYCNDLYAKCLIMLNLAFKVIYS